MWLRFYPCFLFRQQDSLPINFKKQSCKDYQRNRNFRNIFLHFLFYSGQYSLILLTLFVMSTRSAFFDLLKYSILPQHLKEAEIDFRQRFRGYIDLFSSLVRNDFRNLSTFPYLCFGIFLFSSAVIGFISSFSFPFRLLPDRKQNCIKIFWKIFGLAIEKYRS